MLPSASRIRARAHSAHCERKRVVAVPEYWPMAASAASRARLMSLRCRLISASTLWPSRRPKLSPVPAASSMLASISVTASSHCPATKCCTMPGT